LRENDYHVVHVVPKQAAVDISRAP
jgi:hypothetical protein